MPSPFAVSQIWIWTALLVGSLTAPATAQTSRTALTPGTVVISNVGVKEVADAGYDFVKLTTAITRAVYDAVVAEAWSQDR